MISLLNIFTFLIILIGILVFISEIINRFIDEYIEKFNFTYRKFLKDEDELNK